MSYANVTYNGGQSSYAIPFPYISKAHVKVYVDTLLDTNVVWDASDTIHLTDDPGPGHTVLIKRVTPIVDSLVTLATPLNTRDLNTAKRQALYGLQELTDSGGGGGGGGGGSTDWSDITNIPVAWPGTIPYTSVTGKPSTFPSQWSTLANIPAIVAALVTLGMPPATGKVIESTGTGAFHYIDTPSGGGGGGGVTQRPKLLSDFGTVDATGATTTTANDAAITAAEAATDSSVYLDDGIYAKSAATPFGSNLTKAYTGRGIWLEGTTALPAKFVYMATKPTTWPTQGLTGWFRGDQRFTNGGTYHVIGPNVRRYDLTSRYYESNCIPEHHFWDVNSGNSGLQAYLPSTVGPGTGTVIPLSQPADASWVGKTVGFSQNADGTVLESKTITAVNTAGNNITINSALTNTYTRTAGLAYPVILFGHRTWAGHKYVKITAGTTSGGDVYGTVWRTNNNYVRAATEDHPFMTCTAGLCGGDQYCGADYVYQTGWETAHYDKPGGTSFDISSIGFVHSMIRTKDLSLTNGTFWAGVQLQSSGSRPIDVGYNIVGRARHAMDTVQALLCDTDTLAINTTAAGTQIKTIGGRQNGIRLVGDPVTIGEPGSLVYTGTIASFNAGDPTLVNVTPALPGSVINAGTLVTFSYGGAALAMSENQRIAFNHFNIPTTGWRSGYGDGQYAGFYGNVTNSNPIVMGAGTDGSGAFWAVRFPDILTGTTTLPDKSRLRLRIDGVQIYGNLNMTGNFAATGDVYAGSGKQLGLAPNVFFVWDGSNVKVTKNGGGSYTVIV